MKALLFGLLCAFMMFGCNETEKPKFVSSELREFEIIDGTYRNGYLYVHIRDVESGYIYESVFVNRWCNSRHRITRGSRTKLYVLTEYYKTANVNKSRLVGTSSICPD